jgi:hypothetical protein
VIVTVARPTTDEAEAVIVDVAAVTGVVSKPAGVIDPPPVTAHAKLGWEVSGLPNWSAATAVICRVVPATADAVAGDTLIAVSVWATVTVAEEVAVSPLESVIVAVSV